MTGSMEYDKITGFTYTDEGLFQVSLDKVRVNVCPSVLEPLTRARKSRKATMKIRRNPLLRFLPLIRMTYYDLFQTKTCFFQQVMQLC